LIKKTKGFLVFII